MSAFYPGNRRKCARNVVITEYGRNYRTRSAINDRRGLRLGAHFSAGRQATCPTRTNPRGIQDWEKLEILQSGPGRLDQSLSMKIKRVVTRTLPEEQHTLIFRKWEHSKSSNNNPMIILTHTPESGEPEIKDYVPYDTAIGSAKLMMFLNALGIDFEIDTEFETNDLDDLVGLEFRARTRNEEFNRLLSTKIEEYLPAPGVENPEQLARDHIDRVNFAKDRDEFRKDMEAELAKGRTYTSIGGRNENHAAE
jgi:nitroreductase